ncbi:hypothetical protein AeRB84_021365 [Aphanomyces euteiches]|nr:hypothetical protein AeRB84_021365 [Aphanomyces euteiches]
MIYQRMITNALFGFVDLPPGVADLDNDGEPRDMFKINCKYPEESMPPVANRTSFADDISDGAETWDEIVELTDRILRRLTYFNVSISASKSKFGKREIEFLGHWISRRGLSAKPKGLEKLVNLEFPDSLQGIQSFLGSLNFYSRFVENYAIKASSLYEISREDIEAGVVSDTARIAFEELKAAFANLPTLKHAAPDKEVHVLIYTTNWAISATVCQEDEGVLYPIRFCGRVLKGGECRYEGWAKEILALLRVLKTCFFEVRGWMIVVYTRYGPMRWLLKDKQTKAENLHWAAMLAPWTIKVVPVEELDGRWNLPIMLTETLHPPDESTHEKLVLYEPNRSKVGLQPRQVKMPTFTEHDEVYVATFDGAIKVKERFGSWGAVIWKLPSWELIWAGAGCCTDATVNVAEYEGAKAVLRAAIEQGIQAIHVFGDSKLVIHQALEWMQCKQEHLQLQLKSLRALEKQLSVVEYHHILRQWNGSADHLAAMSLATRKAITTLSLNDLNDVQAKNLLAELIQHQPGPEEPPDEGKSAKSIFAYSHPKPTSRVVGLNMQIRLLRVSQAQDRELKWSIIKRFLRGELGEMTPEECSSASKEAGMYGIGEEGALFRLMWSQRRTNLPVSVWNLVIPTELIPVAACETCASGGPPPTTQARSPGNLVPQGPLELINFDIATDLPRSFGGNTQLVVFVDNFTGYVMCKPTPDRSAHTLAKAFEETVFVRFGACKEVRHDREPSFMSEVFTHFMKMIGQGSMPTFAYRPQANGTAERAIQTLVRSVKLYVTDPRQRDWDEYAVRLTFAINTTPSATRGDTPFFLMHGWDPFTTITAGLPSTRSGDHEAHRWRSQLHQQHLFCKAMAHELLCLAVVKRAEAHNSRLPDAVNDRIKVGDLVWVYIDQVKPGVKKKLAHLWHGPFRVLEKKHDYASVLEIRGRLALRNHRFHAEVHDSRLKLQRLFQLRPTEVLYDQPPVDFDEGLYLPPDSFEQDPDEQQVFGVFGVRDVRYTDHIREYEVQLEANGPWVWVASILLPPSTLVYEFERDRLHLDRLDMMVQNEFDVPVEPEGGVENNEDEQETKEEAEPGAEGEGRELA